MQITDTRIDKAYVIISEPVEDLRGDFSRVFCAKEFAERGMAVNFVQSNISHNHRRGTIRGMHRQTKPYEEAKLVRCLSGSVFDVVLDLREDSRTFGKWYGVRLSSDNNKALYVPEGCAHGYQTLEEKSAVLYTVSQYYHPQNESGIKWDDPRFGIQWPVQDTIILSEKDSNEI